MSNNYGFRIESTTYSGETCLVSFLDSTTNQTILLGEETIPFDYFPDDGTPQGKVFIYFSGTDQTFIIDITQPNPSPTPTSTVTPTPTVTVTPTITPTLTVTPTVTVTPSITSSETPTLTPSETPTQTPTVTSSETPTLTPTQTPTVTSSETPTLTPSETPTQTPTITPTETLTPTPTPTQTPTVTSTETPTVTPTITPTITPTSSNTTPTPTPTSTVTPTNVLNSRILYYDFSDNNSYSGTTTVFDLENNSNGTIMNSPSSGSTGCGTFLDFNGTSQYIYTNTNLGSLFSGVSPNKSEVTSIFMWIYPKGDGVILSEVGVVNSLSGWHTSIIEMVSGTLKFGLWSDGSGTISVTSSISTPLNNWYYIGMTYDGSTLTAYVDGVSAGNITFNRLAPYNSGSGLFYLLAHEDGTNMGDGGFGDYKIGSFEIYTTSLTSGQTYSNYINTSSNYICPTPTPTPTNTLTPTNTPTPSSTPSVPVTNNLVLYYDPSNLSSYPGTGTTINDLSGNGLSGTLSNVLFTSPYLAYNGSSSQVTISDNSVLEPGSGDWTMEVWVNQTGSTGSQVILGKFDPGGASQDVSYAIRVSNGSVRADFGNGSTAMNTSNYSLSSNTWYQLTYVFNNVANNNVITYVNGVQQATTTHSFASILNTSTNLYLGSYNNGEYPQYFNGNIGITRLYSSALTSSEVLQNYDANKSKYGL